MKAIMYLNYPGPGITWDTLEVNPDHVKRITWIEAIMGWPTNNLAGFEYVDGPELDWPPNVVALGTDDNGNIVSPFIAKVTR